VRVLLFLLVLAAIARAQSAALDQDVQSYMKARQVEQEWGYDRYQAEARWSVDARAGGWAPYFKAPIFVKGQKVVDLVEDIEWDEGEFAPLARVTLGYDIFELQFDYSKTKIGGTFVVQETFEFQGQIFEVDEKLLTDIGFEQFRIVPGFRVWRSEPVTVTLLAALGISRLHGDFEAEDRTKADFDQLLPIPLLGVNLKGRYGRFVWDAEILGLAIDLDVFGGAVLDVRGGIGFAFTRHISLRAGYRYVQIDGFYGELKAEIRSRGPFLSLVAEF
jgi:opacity protein-like surface antigen